MDEVELRRSLRWAAENGVLREYEVLEARGFGARVMLGTEPIWASLGKEPLDRTPPVKLVGHFALVSPSRLSKSSGGPLYVHQEDESRIEVKFSGVVLSIFESSAEVIAVPGRQEGRLSSTVAIGLGDARAELHIGTFFFGPPIASLRIGEHLQGTASASFTPAHWLGEENMRGVFD